VDTFWTKACMDGQGNTTISRPVTAEKIGFDELHLVFSGYTLRESAFSRP
jgi:hypothetical protein